MVRHVRALALALLLRIVSGGGDDDGVAEPCPMTCKNSSLPNFFNVEYDDDAWFASSAATNAALSVPNHMLTCAMRPAGAARCSVDVMALIEPYAAAADDDVLINVSLDYSGQTTTAAASVSSSPSQPPSGGLPEIRFVSYGRAEKKNVIMLFTLINLSFSWREIDRLASLVNLVVLKLVDCAVVVPPPLPSPPSAVTAGAGGGAVAEPLDNLRSIMTLGLTVSAAKGAGGGGSAPINGWLPAAGVVFPYMAELHVICAAAAATDDDRRDAKNSNILQNVVQIQTCDNPVDVPSLALQMPRLQTLELANFASVDAVPAFPWCAEKLRLPRNLSRTAFFHSHYTNKNSLVLERNVYRRMLVVRGSRRLSRASGCGVAAGIDRVDLDQNALADVAEDCFANASSLQYLKLNSNRLTGLRPGVFATLGNLTKLYLQNNSIASLDGDVFRSLVSLQYLNLASNRLRAIGGGVFDSLAKLRYLSLRDNALTAVEPSAFPVGSTELNYLLLGRNKLADVPLIAFRLRNTLMLELSDNEITFDNLARTLSQIDTDSTRVYSVESISEFDESSQLSAQNTRIKIDLRRNWVRSFPKTALRPAEMRNLEFVSKWFELDLDENPIACDCHAFRFRRDLERVGASAAGFESWKCQTPPEARGLSFFEAPNTTFSCAEPMDGCPVPCDCRRRSVDNATVVDCSNRSLSAIPATMPAPASADGELIVDLRGNRVEALPAAAAGGALAGATSLLLSGNALSSVEGGAIAAMTRLRELSLDNNKLTILPLDIRAAELDALTLRANYWPCDCSNDWMKAWLQRQRSVVSDLYQVTCSSSRDLIRGVPITEVNDDDFVCVDEQYHLKIAVGVAVTLLALTLLCVGLTYRYFSTIKIILYAKFHWHPFDRIDEQADAATKQYDVFVSYSSHDSDWVLGTLCGVLEKRVVPPLRTCVHDKDFTVGCSIHDNIIASVRRSRRMVVVLSEHFVRSEWCMLEFRTAHEKVMKEHSAYLVVILLDDIDVDSLDESLRAYLSTNTYLHVSNRWFWNKLLYVMPQGTRPRLHPDLPPPNSRLDGRSKPDCGVGGAKHAPSQQLPPV